MHVHGSEVNIYQCGRCTRHTKGRGYNISHNRVILHNTMISRVRFTSKTDI